MENKMAVKLIRLYLFASIFLTIGFHYNDTFANTLSNNISVLNSSDVEVKQLCAKYQTQRGWSKGYSIEAQVMSGRVLNSRTSSYSYNSLSTYAVIFWSNEQASIIELSYYTGRFSAYGTRGTDQEGRSWQLAKTRLCY